MGEKEYSVSEAVRLVGVESHVLRYWEEELQVKIHRTSQGHRVYSQGDIALFRRVKGLKEQGIQLRAIRILLSQTETERPDGRAVFTGEERDGLLRCVQAIEWNAVDAQNEEISEDAGTVVGAKYAEDPEIATGTEQAGGSEDPGNATRAEEPEEGSFPSCEVIVEEKKETMRQFEAILKRLISEVMEEQNERLEQALTRAMKDEMEELYLFYRDSLREAAAERTATEERGILGMLRHCFGRK